MGCTASNERSDPPYQVLPSGQRRLPEPPPLGEEGRHEVLVRPKEIEEGFISRGKYPESQPSTWAYFLDLIAAILWTLWQMTGTLLNPGTSIPHRCDVYFWTKTTKRGSSAPSKFWTLSTASGSVCFDHWMVAFEYQDEVLVCDAVNDEGELTGRCRLKGKEEFHRTYARKIHLGHYNVSKEFVKKTVNSMEKNGRYDILSNNCQNWLRKLLNRMSVANSYNLWWMPLSVSIQATKYSQGTSRSGGYERSEGGGKNGAERKSILTRESGPGKYFQKTFVQG